MRRLLLPLVASLLLVAALAVPAHALDASKYGIESFGATLSGPQAGAHSDFTTTFSLKGDPEHSGAPYATTERLRFDLPPGLAGDPAAFPKCTAQQLMTSVQPFPPELEEESCPIDSQVGISQVTVYSAQGALNGSFSEPLYNMASPGGDVVARLGFVALFVPTIIDVRLDPETGYGLTASLEGLSSAETVAATTTTLWGDPTDPNHDPQRITPYEAVECNGTPCTAPGEEPRKSGLAPTPFISAPTRCGAAGTATMEAASYALPESPSILSAPLLPALSGCALLDFSPKISLEPTTTQAESPSGMEVKLTLPQQGLDHPNLLAEAHLKKAVVKLPEGMSLNPAAATGLGACAETQIGLASAGPPIRFNAAEPSCPNSSKVGTAEIKTPLLPEPIPASLYLAAPNDNPFGTLLAGYLVAKGQGVLMKVAGRFDADPSTGRITATFAENPQQPFSDLKLHFKGGPHGVLITPPACGSYGIESKLSPWSAADPENPTPAETASSTEAFPISSGPGGGPCPSGKFDPSLEAWTTKPLAATYSPFVLRLVREDGSQRFSDLSVTLPPGLVGKLAGIPPCPQAAIEAAKARSGLGQGAAELSSPSCPAESQVGTVIAGAGAGPDPFFVQTGRAYLAGPYEGAPLSLVVVTPALAGPFDLGNVVVQATLRINPETAQVTAVSDPLPTTLHGIPLDLRDVRVLLDRPDFVLNPTNCEPMSVDATVSGSGGASAAVSSRFQVGGCGELGFAPKLGTRLFGKTHRGAHPRFRSVLRMPKHGANIARAAVSLPHSEFLDQGHLNNICTRVQFAEGGGNGEKCPAASIYGHAKAWSPLLERPLEGPVYLRSNPAHKLPDLVAALKGPASQPIEVDLDGRIDHSFSGGIRTTFEVVPDAPVSRFVLEMQGGRKGLLVNSENLCAGVHDVTANFRAQNGKQVTLKSPLRSACGGHHRR
jgi:hypothetical protein